MVFHCAPFHIPDIYMAIFAIQSQGIEQTKIMLFILKVLWYSNNLMQKMTSITPSIYEIILFQGFRQAYKRPCQFRFIPSICNQMSLVKSQRSRLDLFQISMVKFGSEHRNKKTYKCSKHQIHWHMYHLLFLPSDYILPYFGT